jgi:uncharacterized protein YyaL (SSP411 family)
VLVFFLTALACTAGEDETVNHEANTARESEHMHTNHLIDENSPYLLSHAHNPVDWFPWGEQALAKAKELDKPIFLSIGYAACHWCHVMERESFENEEIAALLNEHFVSIKVDREQRPDLDQIYMTFTTAMTGRGGWPMSVFLTPDLKPFFAGTYFPPEDKYGRPGFRSVLTQLAKAYREDKSRIKASSEDIFQRINAQIQNPTGGASQLDPRISNRGAEALMRNFDPANGGFGSRPKFPHAMELSLFLRHYKKTGDRSYLEATERSLKAMARGGIYDHVGGGFARYSTDERWLVPHFEKMLYDNGLLVTTYAEAYQITGDELYLRVVTGVLDFFLREMTDRSGGFYSALDADSEGEEGKFYVWSVGEIREVLGADAEMFMIYYNATETGNFEGHNILNITERSFRARENSGHDDFDNRMKEARDKLLAARSKRVRPLTDDKILTSWNGLALSALCKGYQATGDTRYLKAALKNAEFVRDELFINGNLTHSYREGRHSKGLFLEDYAFYSRGLLDLYETDPDNNLRWLNMARKLVLDGINLFQDTDGRFYLRPEGQSDLIMRPRDETDGAIPAPGSIMLGCLVKLARLTEDKALLLSAEKGLRALWGQFAQAPSAMTTALFALDQSFQDKIDIVIVGTGPSRNAMIREVYKRFIPNLVLAVSSDGTDDLPIFEGRRTSGNATAYVCRNSVCDLPAGSLEELKVQLGKI